jgi:hypothetical protein
MDPLRRARKHFGSNGDDDNCGESSRSLSLFLSAKSDGKHEREGGKKQRCARERKNRQVKKR